MHDDDFTPRLGRMRSRGREVRYLGLVVRAARLAGKAGGRRGHFDGSRIGRGAGIARVLRGKDRHAAFRSRRVVVKVRPVRLAGKGVGAAKAHLAYIQRDGVTREGDAAELYAADRDVADGKAFLERCAGDRHQFRIIVSAEDGDQYRGLKSFVRKLMAQMEADLGTGLDWVAVDHFNTGHPHSHIVLRGKTDLGADLVIAREYVAHGVRERATGIVTLDLGPRTDLEIEARLRADTDAERLTAIDRQLVRDMDAAGLVNATDRDPFRQSLRVGRLRKLGRMNLATHLGGQGWRLDPDLSATLRRMGERGDIIRTMQRDLAAQKLERAPADRAIFDPAKPGAAPIVGRVVRRGLDDEHGDRHYLLVDAADGRLYYAAIGKGENSDPTPEGAIVRIEPRTAEVRGVDHMIAEVAAASGGRYSIDAHLAHDAAASEAFARTHVRRLEAMRKTMGNIVREADGSWAIAPDHLDRAAAFERRRFRDRPVTVEILSAIPLDRLATLEAATFIDRDLVAPDPAPVRDAGFGRELLAARRLRRQWLIGERLATEQGGATTYRRDMLAALQRRELLRVAAQLSTELGKPFREVRTGTLVEGRLVRPVDLASGRFALVERSHDFALLPWRQPLERHVGKEVSGTVRNAGISWTIGRRHGRGIS